MIIELWGGPMDGDIIDADEYTMEEHLEEPGIFEVDHGEYVFTIVGDIIVAVYKED